MHCDFVMPACMHAPLISDVIQFIQEIQMTSFVDALKHGSMGTGQLATELCENLGLERYDAMDAWILGIVDS